jgi:hypothetical protein
VSDGMPALLSRKNARLAAGGLAGLRIVIGATAWVAPSFALSPWIGSDDASSTGGRLLARSLGSRDVGLGAGALLAMRHGGPARGWIEAGALSDVGDTVASLIAFPRLPARTRWAVLALTLGAVVAGAVIAPCVDRTEEADDDPEEGGDPGENEHHRDAGRDNGHTGERQMVTGDAAVKGADGPEDDLS